MAADWNYNHLLTEHEGRTGEYWPEFVAVKTTEGQSSPVPFVQARLAINLLYRTRVVFVFRKQKI